MVESKKSLDKLPSESLAEVTNAEVEFLRSESAQLRKRLHELEALVDATGEAAIRAKHKALQEAIDLTKADLERAETMSRTGSWSRDLDTGISIWSPGKLRLFGLDPNGPTPDFDAMLAMVHPDDRAQVVQTLDEAEKSGEQHRLVYRIRTSNGERAIESLVRPILEERRMVGTVQDVTEDITAAIELVQSEQRLRTIVDNLNEGLLLKDPSGHILLANPASERMMECPADLLVGRTTHHPSWKLIRRDGSPLPPGEHPTDLAITTKTIQRDVLIGMILPSGLFRWLQCTAAPLFDGDGSTLSGVLCTFTDFTDSVNAENKLAEVNALRGAILASTDCSIVSMDTEGTILSFNHASETMLGYSEDEVIGASSFDILLAPEEIESYAREIQAEVDVRTLFHDALEGNAEEREWTMVRKDGSRFPAMLAITAMRTEEQRLLGFLGVARDISRSKASEEALRASEARLSEAQRLARSGSWETDLTTGAASWSAGLFELLGLDPAKHIPDQSEFLKCIHTEDREIFQEAVAEAEKSGQSFDIEFRYLRSDAEVMTLHTSAQVFLKDGRPGRMLGHIQDVTERKAAQRQIEWQMRTISSYAAELEAGKRELERANARLEALATTDGLTGIMNHRAFQEKVDHEFKRARRYETPLSLLLIDVDKFKSYNDSFGHQAGDEVLRAVANTLSATGRQTDWIARYGGEEFVVILPETGLDQALDAAERFRVAINSRALGSRELSISVGVSTLAPVHLKPADLVSDSDRALYFAKANGRNRVAWVDPQTHNPMVGP